MGQVNAVHVKSEAEARALAARLNSGARTKPVVVVTSAAGQSEPYVDVDDLSSTLGDLAEIQVIPTGEVSWAFSDAMPPMTQVYGGASRVYPVGLEWTTHPHRSPLRFAYGVKDRTRVTDLLVSDAMAMALAAGLLGAHAPNATLRAEGTVMGVVGSRAMVNSDHGVVTIWPELTVADVEADRLFSKGMPVEGHLDPVQRRLDVRDSLVPAEQLLVAYQPGATVLARVTRLDAGGCHVELVPGTRVFVGVSDASGTPGLPLTSLMTVGETVSARVVKVGEPSGKGWRLTLVDIDPDAVPAAVALLPGGPPWLTPVTVSPPELAEDVDEAAAVVISPALPVETATATTALPAEPSEIAALQSERDAFLAELEVVRARVERLERSREQLRRQAREAGNEAERRRREVQALTEELGRGANDAHLFADPKEQLEFDVQLTWARRIPSAEKASLPLARYDVGPQLLRLLAVDRWHRPAEGGRGRRRHPHRSGAPVGGTGDPSAPYVRRWQCPLREPPGRVDLLASSAAGQHSSGEASALLAARRRQRRVVEHPPPR